MFEVLTFAPGSIEPHISGPFESRDSAERFATAAMSTGKFYQVIIRFNEKYSK
jgi:hypothetical protein